MQNITSASNEKIKKIVLYTGKASARKEDGVFIAEGTKLVTEAPHDLVREIYISETCLDTLEKENGPLLKAFLDLRKDLYEDSIIKLPDHIFEKISGQKTPQGILAVLKSIGYKADQLWGNGESDPLILVLEDIQDPGNVGTIFRTAEAAGVTGIILSDKCADPLGPKTVRSTMGAIFRMPFLISKDLPGEVRKLEEDGIACYAARLDGALEYDICDFRKPCAILIGNEGKGLTDKVSKEASNGVYIPMSGKTESLNAAVSASILSYEARRQRNSL